MKGKIKKLRSVVTLATFQYPHVAAGYHIGQLRYRSFPSSGKVPLHIADPNFTSTSTNKEKAEIDDEKNSSSLQEVSFSPSVPSWGDFGEHFNTLQFVETTIFLIHCP